jgi:hypothetical protein
MRIILIFGSIYLDHLASSIEKTKEKGGMYTSFTTGYKKQGVEDHKPARSLLRGYYGMCRLNHSTEDDSDNLGEKGGGKRSMALPHLN